VGSSSVFCGRDAHSLHAALSTVGAGILALPSAFKNGGVLASAILMAILAVGVNYCIRCLLVSVDYCYAREHNLEYDSGTGKFSLGEGGIARESRSINEADEQDGVNKPLKEDSQAQSDEDELRTSQSGLVMTQRSPRVTPARTIPSSDFDAPARRAAVPSDFDPLAHQPMYSYRDIGEFAYGWKGCLAVDFNLIASQLGFCIAYVSFISQNMIKVTDVLTRIEWVLVLAVAWSLLIQIRDIRKIAFTSMFGNIVYMASLAIIFYDGFSHSCCVSTGDTAWVRVSGLALVFGTGCFALEGIGLVLPVKSAMKDQEHFSSVLNIAIAFVATCYVVFGVFGYLFYGDAVESVITKNLTAGGLSNAVRISLSISLFFTYAIQMFPVSEIVDEVWDTRVFYPENQEENKPLTAADAEGNGTASSSLSLSSESTYQALSDQQHPQPHTTSLRVESQSEDAPVGGNIASSDGSAANKAHSRPTTVKRELTLIGSRIGLVIFTAGVSIAFPNFGLIVSLVGSFSNSAIAFILPQIFYIKLVLAADAQKSGTDSSPYWFTRWRAYLLPLTIVVLGCCASAIGVYTTIRDMVTGDDS
jgi:amino acid permease